MLSERFPTLATTSMPLPEGFEGLDELAYNLWWAWDHDCQELWARIDPRRWHDTENPVALLQGLDPSLWDTLAHDESFQANYQAVLRRFRRYLGLEDAWYQQLHRNRLPGPVAYVCAEFGLHHRIPLYSGGLGVLAGDHLKTASDLGLPMVAVGLLYRGGYFSQTVDPDGDQQHFYPPIDLAQLPIRRLADRTGYALTVKIPFPGREVRVGVWKLQVGRIPLLLLDTDLPDNNVADRPITRLLYVRGRDMRLAQELVLGVGAVKVLRALALEPSAWHVNEGHSAFNVFERIATLVKAGHPLPDALSQVRSHTLFTLHTPLPAGNESFAASEVARHLEYQYPALNRPALVRLGQVREGDSEFNLGALAIRSSSFVNGVSRIHGQVATREWNEVNGGPVTGITNGVHVPSWIGSSIRHLLEETIGRDWEAQLTDPEPWTALEKIADEDLWEAHQTQKRVLLRSIRERWLAQLVRHGAGPDSLRATQQTFPEDRLTLTFARRFATYKRPTLLLHDLNRLQAILTNPERPVQILFAGKAHPADEGGQELIKRVVELSVRPEFRGHLIFVEDYSMGLARLLVAGSDVWLNNPVPPFEASGTSGMKAAANGCLNLSVADGWWAEAVEVPGIDWQFGVSVPGSQNDDADAQALYWSLESHVIPLYYQRDEAGLPRAWLAQMKRTMASLIQRFSSHRMLLEYAEQAYFPLGTRPDPNG